MTYPKHELVGNVLIRQESGGSERRLSVWSLDTCIAKIKEKTTPQLQAHFFQELAAWAHEEVCDPMVRAWRLACFVNTERAWEMLNVVAQPATIEEFGFDTLEEFGL